MALRMTTKAARRVKNASHVAMWLGALIVFVGVGSGPWIALILTGISVYATAMGANLWGLSAAQDAAQREAEAAAREGPASTVPLVLFLRSFDVAAVGILPRIWSSLEILGEVVGLAGGGRPGNDYGRFDPEEQLADAIAGYGRFVAIGNKRASYGAGKITVSDEDWKSTFLTLTDTASLIVMMPGPSASVEWECSTILRSTNLLRKTAFVMPRAHSRLSLLREAKSLLMLDTTSSLEKTAWRQTAEFFMGDFNIALPSYDSYGCCFRLGVDGACREIVALEAFTAGLAGYEKHPRNAANAGFDVEEIWKLAW